MPGKSLQAVILAGGRGERLRPWTDSVPKPMVPIHGRPFLAHQVELLRRSGFQRVLLLIGYMGNQIREHFGDGSRYGIQMGYCSEDEPLGTGGALRNAAARLEEEFVLLNGDTYLPLAYQDLNDAFHASRAVGVITAYAGALHHGPYNLALGAAHEVTAYDKRHPGGMTHVDAGVSVFRRELFEFFPAGDACSLEEEVLPRLIAAKQLRGFPTQQRFYDMGTAEGLRQLEDVLQ